LALVEGEVLEVVVPPLQLADHRGAGDSITAGLAAALTRGSGPANALRLGSAAGALTTLGGGWASASGNWWVFAGMVGTGPDGGHRALRLPRD